VQETCDKTKKSIIQHDSYIGDYAVAPPQPGEEAHFDCPKAQSSGNSKRRRKRVKFVIQINFAICHRAS